VHLQLSLFPFNYWSYSRAGRRARKADRHARACRQWGRLAPHAQWKFCRILILFEIHTWFEKTRQIMAVWYWRKEHLSISLGEFFQHAFEYGKRVKFVKTAIVHTRANIFPLRPLQVLQICVPSLRPKFQPLFFEWFKNSSQSILS